MTKDIAGHDTVDFESSVPTLTLGRIRTHGANFIIHTDAGEVVIARSSVLASVLGGEGASLAGVVDGRYTSTDLEGAITELRALIKHAQKTGGLQVNTITPLVVYNRTHAAPVNQEEFSVASLPAQATHAVCKVTTTGPGGATKRFYWWGLGAGQSTSAPPTFLNQVNTPPTVIQTLLLPIGAGQKMHIYQHSTGNPGTLKLEITGWLEITGISAPPDQTP